MVLSIPNIIIIIVLYTFSSITTLFSYTLCFYCSQPPDCGLKRTRRQAGGDSSEGTPATIEVYSGLYVNEANDLAKAAGDEDYVYSEKVSLPKKGGAQNGPK